MTFLTSRYIPKLGKSMANINGNMDICTTLIKFLAYTICVVECHIRAAKRLRAIFDFIKDCFFFVFPRGYWMMCLPITLTWQNNLFMSNRRGENSAISLSSCDTCRVPLYHYFTQSLDSLQLICLHGNLSRQCPRNCNSPGAEKRTTKISTWEGHHVDVGYQKLHTCRAECPPSLTASYLSR